MDTIQEHLCKCLKCDTVLIDENPQVGAKLYELHEGKDGLYRTEYELPVLEGEWFNYGEGRFFGCDQCKTDEYLIDL